MSSESAAAPSIYSADTDPNPASTPQTLARAVYDRRTEYVRPHSVRLKIGTWNVAAKPGTDKDLAAWFVSGQGFAEALVPGTLSHASGDKTSSLGKDAHNSTKNTAGDDENNSGDVEGVRLVGGNDIGLYVLGLQEIVDLGLAKEAYNRVYGDSPTPIGRWRTALEEAMPPGYTCVAAEQMSGLLLLAYASPELRPSITDISFSHVGTGLLGYMGNKGSISGRLLLGETTRLVFTNAHLASGPEPAHLDRRYWDVAQVQARTQFPRADIPGAERESETEGIGDADFAFWFGDLNFRVDGLPGADIRRLLWLHTQGEYDLTGKAREDADALGESVLVSKTSGSEDGVMDRSVSPSPNTSFVHREHDELDDLPDPDDFIPDPHEDPTSLQATLDSLLPHDQLRRAIKDKKAFHDGWREAPITFLPTYKYDVGTVGLFDSSEKQRAPSWCDRVLYRTRRDFEEYQDKVREEEDARKRDEEMKAMGVDEAAEDEGVLFSYDPETDGASASTTTVEFDYDEYDEEADDGDDGDVVLTKDGFKDRIHMDLYASHQRITSSDHKPVVSVFTLEYDAVVPEMKAKVHAEVVRQLDRAENEGRPSVTIVADGAGSASRREGDAVDFGEVTFLERKSCSLTVANTGGVPATFSFVEKPGEGETGGKHQEEWLTTKIIPMDTAEEGDGGEHKKKPVGPGREVTLEPGETATILLEMAVVHTGLARSLNYDRTRLEDVLVLRVTDGRDHFIPVRAGWSPTSFGRSIDELIRIPDGGIRAFVCAPPSDSPSGASSGECRRSHTKTLSQTDGADDAPTDGIKGAIPYDRPVRHAAPKELFKLTEALQDLLERSLADESMLEEYPVPRAAPGWPFDPSSWTLRDEDVRSRGKEALISAADGDEPLVPALTEGTKCPAVQNIEVLAETMVLFLEALTDGVIPSSVWPRLPHALLTPTSRSEGSRDEDVKVEVLDALSSSPNHNISFVFLTTTLSRLASDLSPTEEPGPEQAPQTPTSRLRTLSLRRVVRGGGNASSPAAAPSNASSSAGSVASTSTQGAGKAASRASRVKKLAEMFEPLVVRLPAPSASASEKEKEKERKAAREKARYLLELFLRREA